MSLASHLRVRNDPVRGYIEGVAPEVARIAHRTNEAMRLGVDALPKLAVPQVTEGRALAATAGIAFDYRLRYTLGVQPSEELIAWIGGQLLVHFDPTAVSTRPGDELLIELAVLSFFESLDELLARLQPTGRHLADEDERLLCRYCVALAHLESIHRASGVAGYTPPFVGEIFAQLRARRRVDPASDRVLAAAQEEEIEEVVRLSRSAESVFGSWSAAVARGELYYVANPGFEGGANVGGADADFVIGDTLFELKATRRLIASAVREALLQLIGYSLLDFSDEYRIRSLGVYFARHGWVATWPIGDLIAGEGDVGARLAEARREMRRRFRAPRRVR
jgi:hypothetical protein